MTQQQTGRTTPARPHQPAATGWVGWVIFAGVLMLLVGISNVIAGFLALFKDDYYLVAPTGLVVDIDYTAWGWTLLAWGLLLGVVGLGVLFGQTWARVSGVILVGGNALLNLGFLAAYPIWIMLVIVLDVIVIYALIVHGRETRAVDFAAAG